MPFFKHRPFALYCLAFSAAVCGAELLFLRFSAPLLITAAVLFSLFSALFFVFRKKRFSRFFLRSAVCIAFAFLGLLSHFVLAQLPENELCTNEGECTATLLIEEKLYDSFDGTSYKARVLTVKGEKARGRVLFTCRDGMLESGDVIEAAVLFSSSEASDKRSYLRSNGMVASADAAEDAEIAHTEKRTTLHSISARLRSGITARIERATAGTDAGICAALLVGVRKGISDIAYLDFTRAGILHMLAISGMHFTVLMGAIGFLLHKMRLPKAARIAVLFLSAALYTVLAGFSYSVLRAAIMLFAVYTAYFLRRERDVYTSLFASFALILAFEPTAAASVGLWLSVFATAGVIFASELAAKRLRPLGFFGGTVVMPLFISLCAQIGTLPITFMAFEKISPSAALATLACTLPVNILLFASVPLAVIGTPIPLLTEAVSAVCRLLLTIAAFFSDTIPLYPLNYPFVPFLVLAVTLFAAAAILSARKTRRIFLALALLAVIALPVCTVIYEAPRRDVSAIGVQSYNQNDILVLSTDKGNAVIDASNGSKRAVSSADGLLGELHRTEADVLILTRLNNAAINAVINYGTSIKVHKIYYPAPQTDEEAELTKRLIANISRVRAEGEEYRLGEAFDAVGIDLCIHSEYAEHSTVPIRAVSAEIGEKNILYVSSGITHSAYIQEIRRAAASADMLIIGAAGPKNKLPLHFTAKCTTVLPTKETLNSLSEPYRALIDDIDVYYSDQAVFFNFEDATASLLP